MRKITTLAISLLTSLNVVESMDTPLTAEALQLQQEAQKQITFNSIEEFYTQYQACDNPEEQTNLKQQIIFGLSDLISKNEIKSDNKTKALGIAEKLEANNVKKQLTDFTGDFKGVPKDVKDVVQLILTYVTDGPKIKNIMNILSIDTKFREVAKSTPINLNLSTFREKISDQAIKNISELFPNMNSLKLFVANITNTGLAPLKNLKNITSFHLSNCDLITSEGLGNLSELPQLESLSIIGSNITDLLFLNGMVLKYLELKAIHCVESISFKKLKKLSKLELLNISGQRLENVIIEDIIELAPILKSLTISSSKFNNDGLAHLKGMTHLTSLHLENSSVFTDNGLLYLNELTQLTSLTLYGSYRLSTGYRSDDNKITNAGLQNLKNLVNLTYLDLSYNNISGEGICHLKRLTGLKFLNVSYTNISDIGLKHLSDNFNKLESLDLYSCNKITDSGLGHLSKMPYLRLLKISYFNEKITDTGLAKLSKEINVIR